MPKQLVETTGDFELVDFGFNGQIISHSRPSVIEPSTFTSARAAVGQIKFLANLNDEATDEEFAKYVQESPKDIDFAVESFKSAFSPEAGSSKGKQPTEEVTSQPKQKNSKPNTTGFTA